MINGSNPNPVVCKFGFLICVNLRHLRLKIPMAWEACPVSENQRELAVSQSLESV